MAEREEAIFYLLTHDAELAELVEDRVFNEVLRQGVEYPAIAFKLVDEARDEEVEEGASGIVDARVQFDILAKTFESAGAVRRRLIELIRNFAGVVQGFEITRILADNASGIPYDEATKSAGYSVDFIISHRE